MFAALPMRAIGDTRLTSLHLRTLACIAFHDRLSGPRGKRPGAWASLKTLSKRVRCHYTSASTAISELVEFGYVVRDRAPFDARRRVYRVIYDEPSDPSVEHDGLADEKDLPPEQIYDDLRERMHADAILQFYIAAGESLSDEQTSD